MRYSKEKGEGDVKLSQKQKTSDIQFFPAIVSPGDTVTIVARVHNFSLKNFNGTLPVDFYINDTNTNETRLININGMNRVNKSVTMDFSASHEDTDNEEFIVFKWKVPVTTTCSPRIYAVIDPLNTINEIHEDNNIGWNKLSIFGCDLCGEVSSESAVLSNFNVHVYPNPVSSSASIRFTLSAPERVKMELYSLTGIKVGEINEQLYPGGEHMVPLSVGNLTEGIYLLRSTAGKNVGTTKIVLMH